MARKEKNRQRSKRSPAYQKGASATAYRQALAAFQRDEFSTAEAICREILQKEPSHAQALFLAGLSAHGLGNNSGARRLLNQATALEPENPEFLYHLALVLQLGKEIDAAIACYQKTLRLKPDQADAWDNLGVLYHVRNNPREARECHQKALEINPRHGNAHLNLAKALIACGEKEQAIAHQRAGVALQPGNHAALADLGVILQLSGNIGEAVDCLQRALAQDGSSEKTLHNLGSALLKQRRYEEALRHYLRALEVDPFSDIAINNTLFLLNYLHDALPQDIFGMHRQLGARLSAPAADHFQFTERERNPNRRLRIGYVSPDFKNHSVAFFFMAIARHHSREHTELICYANGPKEDAVTARLKELADQWRDISAMEDAEAARIIFADRVDILVDLAGHTANSGIRIFGRKPAPIQVTYLGYPNTTGLPEMDYRLTDAVADPTGKTEHLHTETLVRLPDCFLCYTPAETAPPVAPPPAATKRNLSFGSFNNLTKINTTVVAAWASILKAVPESTLLIKSHLLGDEKNREFLLRDFMEQGIPAQRITLRGKTPTDIDHLAMYGEIDIALDTFPYNGTTTTCEALWMGVPVIVLAGETHVARVGASLLSAIGLEELVALSEEEYAAKAIDLAHDPQRLSTLRATMRDRMQQSPLMDGQGFARKLEAAYREMWRRWCAQYSHASQTEHPAQELPGHKEPSSPLAAKQEPARANILNGSEQFNGEELFGQQQYGAATEAFRRDIEQNPNDEVAHNNLGVALWRLGDAGLALQSFQKALTINPTYLGHRQPAGPAGRKREDWHIPNPLEKANYPHHPQPGPLRGHPDVQMPRLHAADNPAERNPPTGNPVVQPPAAGQRVVSPFIAGRACRH